MEDTPSWGYDEPVDEHAIEEPSVAEESIPLKFHQFFAQAGPIDGVVDRSKVESLLARAHISDEDIIEILKENAPIKEVDEVAFSRVLFAAARRLNQDPESIDFDSSVDSEPADQTPEFIVSGPRAIKVEIKPGKEGRWGFKHTVYIVTGHLRGAPVLVHRRYSDFVWLLDYLVKVYPFRVLPLLPPKKVQINGRFMSGDSSQFLYRRRLGLSRFLNLLVMHPLITNDKAVVAFLTNTSPIDLLKNEFHPVSEMNGSATPSFMLEFDEKKFLKWLESMQLSTAKSLLVTTNAAKMFAIQSRRLYVQASDACNLTMDFESLVTQLKSVYPNNTENLEQITRGVAILAKHNEQEHGAYLDSAAALQDGALDDIKYYRDILLATCELFRRHRTLGGNTIIQLKNRIDRIRTKIDALRGGPNQEQIEKLEAQIDDLQLDIRNQINRMWLMRQILSSELKMVQTSQYQLSRMIRNFASYRLAMTESFKMLASNLFDQVSDLPLK